MMSSCDYQREAETADRQAQAATDGQAKKAYETIAAAYRLLAARAARRELLQNNRISH
jgi:hypothetical protein